MLKIRNVAPPEYITDDRPAGLVVHFDRGSQYASTEHRALLACHDFVGSAQHTTDV